LKVPKFTTSYLQKNYTTLPYKLIKGRKSTGALAVNTGEYGRSPQDRFIVKDSISEDLVWWGK
jgi:ATP-dependent phosphoenolpyruvate carboxykinase